MKKFSKCFIVMLIASLVLPYISSISKAETNKKEYSANIKSYTYKIGEPINDTEIDVNLTTYTFNHPASTYNFFDENGILNSVYASNNNVYWSKFDSNMKLIKTVNWPLFYNWRKEENPAVLSDALAYNFGGAIYYNGYLYVMYSRMSNSKTSEGIKEQKTMAMGKYDQDGKMVKIQEYLGIELNPHSYYEEMRYKYSILYF